MLLSRVYLRKFLLLSTSSKYMTCFLSSSETQANIFFNFSLLLPGPRGNVPQLLWFKMCISRSNRRHAIQYSSSQCHETGFLILLSTQVKMQIVTRAGITFCADFILSKLRLHSKSVENPGLCWCKAAVITLKAHLDQYDTGFLVKISDRRNSCKLKNFSLMFVHQCYFCYSREKNKYCALTCK